MIISTTKEWLSSHFEIKDMSESEFILRIKIQRNHSMKLIAFSHESYINKILQWFNMHNCKPMDTPIVKGKSLNLSMCPKSEEGKQLMSKIQYANVVSSVIHAMIWTTPDIGYVVGLVNRF